ncbi:MAG: metal-dependent hydrolase [Candidatus Bathyarchaeia archaeon]
MAIKRGKDLFAVGHLSLGYLFARGSARLLSKKVNIPLILTLSVLPDVDILLKQLGIEHRGPTHSIIVLSIAFIPFFIIYRKEVIPYFIAIIQHSLVGDLIAGGSVRLLWPATIQFNGIGIEITSQTNVMLEWFIFLISMFVMLKTNDIKEFFQPQLSNLLLSVPAFTVLLPTVVSFPLVVPLLLEPPHFVYMFLFFAAAIIALYALFKGGFRLKIVGKQGAL